MTSGSLRSEFHHDLFEIRETIAFLAATVTDDILRATDILLHHDVDGAERLLVADASFNDACVSLEQRCHRILALQAPVASDLRELVVALRVIPEVARSADLAMNVSKSASRLAGHVLQSPMRRLIEQMGQHSSRLFREATESYLQGDAARAAALPDMDDLLDGLQHEFVLSIFDARDPGEIDLAVAVQLAVLARYYERLGDHAVNIGHSVSFLVTGAAIRS